MTLVAIDPGLANTAVLVLEDGRITSSCTWVTPSSGPRPTFAEALARATTQANRLHELLVERDPGEVVLVIEAYEDFGGKHKRSVRHRWTTPMVCALLGDRARALGIEPAWQLPSLVMSHYGDHKRMWAAGVRGLIAGDELVTNDHERSAACHALAWMNAHGRKRSQA